MNDAFITRDGRPLMTIVAGTSDTDRYAASELASYLRLITNTSLPVLLDASAAPTTPGGLIAVGEAAARVGVSPEDSLGDDGYLVRTVGSNLAITGGRRGVIYGVYEFLEHLGCRFFTPTCERVPGITDLALPDLDMRHVPGLEYRYHNYTDYLRNPRFAVKNRINGPVPIKEKFGGHLDYVWFVHTFDRILNPEEWFDSHPEFFSMVHGERVRHRTQLCLTNPEVLRRTIEKVREALAANPDKRLISVSQNDWANNCTCPDCARLDAYEGSSSGSLIHFVNRVAEAIEPDFPDAIIDTLAYQYSRPAPRHVRPRQNVCVRLCSIEACFAHPLEACDDATRHVMRPDGTRSSFIRDLEEWAEVCDRLYIWDYTTCFAHYPAPFPNWRALQPNMQAFARNNVRGVFEQACGAVGGGVDLNELRAYLIGRLLWDPSCDYERHKSEFLETYYGDASPLVAAYLETLCDVVDRHNIHLGFNDQCDRPHLSEELLDRYEALLREALDAVIGDPVRLMRVARILLSIRWVRIKNRAMLHGQLDPETVREFFLDWRAHGLTRIDEWVAPETTHRALIEGRWRGTEYYDHWTDEGPEEL